MGKCSLFLFALTAPAACCRPCGFSLVLVLGRPGVCGVDVPRGSFQPGGGQDVEGKHPNFHAVKG